MKLFAIAAVAALMATPALAGTSVAVRTGGLNLSDSQDAAVMLRRLDIAAAQACGAERGSVRDVQVAVRRSACYADAMDTALVKLNAPAVDALHRDRDAQVAALR
ncbi:UrcA family protein [Phenylobacterium sp. SCN 70-31]|uniref:UrcA family protein n=1 Tax=Phenylobacterium sp. SCN 70-31 TaxID=1660129 RepID=UPI0008690EC1|nr:UrcA family protein [Phenylobacterium sp. SCN 70-31]ODT85726.1 MAG: hypothetical protein ABS78_19360 [Phenylobacterium sp. SCN 70-31]